MSDQQPVELILMRQLASLLAFPVWIMDATGNLAYYNGPAEELLGIRFDDAGPLSADELVDTFKVTDELGQTIDDEELPVVAALRHQVSAHNILRFCGMDGQWREVQVTAMPLVGQGERFLGAFAAFWEVQS